MPTRVIAGVSRSAQSWVMLRRPRGSAMRQRDLALSFLAVPAAAFVTLAAQATPLPAPVKIYSLVEKIGCRGPGTYCRAGRHWVCGPYRCWCAPCSYGGPRPYWGRARMPPSGVRALRAFLVPRLCTTSCSMRQAIAPWLIPSRALQPQNRWRSGRLHLIGSRK